MDPRPVFRPRAQECGRRIAVDEAPEPGGPERLGVRAPEGGPVVVDPAVQCPRAARRRAEHPQVLVGEAVLAHRRPPDGGADGPCAAEAEERLREPGNLEEEHVPAPRELTAVPAEMLDEDRRMGTVEHDEPPRRVRTLHREAPGDCPAPVVPDDHRLVLAEGPEQPVDVGHQLRHGVGADAGGLVTLVVAAHVRRHHPEVGREGRYLVAPRVPALRKAV